MTLTIIRPLSSVRTYDRFHVDIYMWLYEGLLFLSWELYQHNWDGFGLWSDPSPPGKLQLRQFHEHWRICECLWLLVHICMNGCVQRREEQVERSMWTNTWAFHLEMSGRFRRLEHAFHSLPPNSRNLPTNLIVLSGRGTKKMHFGRFGIRPSKIIPSRSEPSTMCPIGEYVSIVIDVF